MINLYVLTGIIVIGAVTFLLRALPFMMGRYLHRYAFIQYVQNRLPLVMMFILTVYASNLVKKQSIEQALPILIALLMISLCQLLLKNTLLSIGLGVLLYCSLLQFISF